MYAKKCKTGEKASVEFTPYNGELHMAVNVALQSQTKQTKLFTVLVSPLFKQAVILKCTIEHQEYLSQLVQVSAHPVQYVSRVVLLTNFKVTCAFFLCSVSDNQIGPEPDAIIF